MRVHIVPATCSLCGGDGLATPSASAAQMYGVDLFHHDPQECKRVLAERARAEQSASEQTGVAS